MDTHAFSVMHQSEGSWWYRGRVSAIKSALARSHIAQVNDVLDFGAGYGGMREELSKIGTRVYAFEPDSEARKAATGRGYAQVFGTEGEALARTYDLIGLFDVVEHIEDDREFLLRLKSALDEYGYLAITVPAYQFLWSSHDVANMHFRRYTRASICKLLKECGFTVEYASYWNTVLFPLALTARVLGFSGESSFGLPRAIDAIFYACVVVESWLMRFVRLPFGVSIVVIARKK